MHWVDRGPAPEELAGIHASNTARWVQYYENQSGTKPTDSYWRRFRSDLDRVFSSICAYCEEFCRGEVDHFRPKSRYPGLVYEWSNWLFVCHDCNHAKLEKWPPGGYVDPCAKSEQARPERWFTFDLLTGELIPREDLTAYRRIKAQKMVTDLDLNGRHHLKERAVRLLLLSALENPSINEIPDELKEFFSNVEEARSTLASRNTGLSSITRFWLSQQKPGIATVSQA